MKKNIDKNIDSLHPSDSELADYIADKLDSTKKSEIVKHLIECDECSDIVALIKRYGVEVKELSATLEPTIANNWWLDRRVWGIALSGLTASFVLFITLPSQETKLGIMDLSKMPTTQFKGVADIKLIDKKVDADKILSSIIKDTDLSHIDSFNEGINQEKLGNLEEAKVYYTQSIMQITMNSDINKSLQQKIVIHSRLLDLSIKSKDKKSIEEYKDLLRYEIRLYITKKGKKR